MGHMESALGSDYDSVGGSDLDSGWESYWGSTLEKSSMNTKWKYSKDLFRNKAWDYVWYQVGWHVEGQYWTQIEIQVEFQIGALLWEKLNEY